MPIDLRAHGLSRRSVLAGSLAFACLLRPSWLAAAPVATVATTRAGIVRGLYQAGSHRFRGIPYAASTAGRGRFMPPQRVIGWKGERDATRYGPRAPQLPSPPAYVPFQDIPIGEDCLVVNVWTRGVSDGAKRPIMVWLHPGGFSVGSGGDYTGDGTLTLKEDVVLVEVNHRLGVFGYLHLGDHDPHFAESGCAGMLDIVAALKWVKDNAAAFGGDPGNVTIFGESGGGAKVMALMAMPSAKGLFHRAISESGLYIKGTERPAAKQTADKLFVALGLRLGDVAALQTVPIDRLLKAAAALPQGKGGLAPTVGTSSLPHHPFSPDAPNISKHVPYIIGVNQDEMLLYRALSPDKAKMLAMTEQDVLERLRKEYPTMNQDTLKELVAYYKAAMPQAIPCDIYFRAASDIGIRSQSIIAAGRKAALGGAPAYLYLFAWPGTPIGGVKGAFHGSEMSFTFDRLNLPDNPVSETPETRKLADEMRGAWGAFARTGNPNHARLPEWRPYDNHQRDTMVFDAPSKLISDLRGAELEALSLSLPEA